MLTARNIFFGCVAFSAAAIWVFSSQGFQIEGHVCPHGYQGDESQCPTHNILMIWLLAIDKYHDVLLVIGTFFLAGGTVLLAGFVGLQLRDTRISSERQLRAYIGVEPRGVKKFIGEDVFVGHVAIRNYGKIPAKNVSMFTATSYFIDGSQKVFTIGDLYPSKTSLQPRA